MCLATNTGKTKLIYPEITDIMCCFDRGTNKYMSHQRVYIITTWGQIFCIGGNLALME